MKLAGEYTFDAPRDQVWEALFDPEILASVMPGCENLDLVGEQEYEGLLKIKVGPVQGKFEAKIKLADIEAPDSYSMDIDGRGAPGFVKAEAKVWLTDDDDGKTVLHYDSDAKVGGRVATVGQRLLDSSAKAITKQSLEGLAKVMEARASTPEGEEPAKIEGPSQSEFARQVAKEVVKDLVPLPVLIGGIVVLVIILIFIFAR